MPRIAIGSCSCERADKMTGASKIACEQISAKLEQLKKLSFAQISDLPAVDASRATIDGFDFLLATQIARQDNELLVVVQVFHPTWSWPTYIGTRGVGKMFVEGIVFTEQGDSSKAPDELLWEYR